MKIAITSHGKNRHAPVDSRFNRANYFILYDRETASYDFLPNTPDQKSVQALAKAGVNILITGYVSPKAFKALHAEQIKIYSFGDTIGTVEDILSAFWAGKLTTLLVPNALDIKK